VESRRVVDAVFMDRALALAERGRGRTTPNPIVGAVIVSDGVVVGQGAHLEAGGPHAEVHALDAAGARARGATLYCTLEPCAHTGRTGPCVERIAAAGLARVVAAVRDPNPRVAGRGLEYLRAHGIEVAEGVRADAASGHNAPFFTWVLRHRPFVTLKTAVSIDGFVGRRDGPVRLTSAAADRYLHRQRAEVDAIAVGSETVLIDDPLLTARGAYRYRPLIRVLFDWRVRLPTTARVFSTLGAGPVIMAVTAQAADANRAHIADLERRGVSVERYEHRDVRMVAGRLAARGVVSLLVEGGPTLHDAFAEAGLVDRVQWVVTPGALGCGVRMTGGVPGPFGAQGARTRALGDDVLIEIDVHGTD
jgi:diaminohydroxyphosphoribosylaminopyrimidine deaminase/5-amino-6-(5-phosphoribosylamino)uracil reductase